MPETHPKKKNDIFKITFNLAVTCLVSGAILALAYFFTNPIAVQKAKAMETESMRALVTSADSIDAVKGQSGMYEATSGGKAVAYIVSVAPKGYGGPIDMLVAVSPDGKVLNFSITSSNETPGLGSKASEPAFKDQFAGKTSEDLAVTKDKSNTQNIQAMTGATISSKAVTKGVKEAVDEVVGYTGGK